MSFPLLLFFVLAFIAIAAAIAMLQSKNPVYSALFLIVNFSIIAVFYLQLGAPFLSLAQIAVYGGAIMVLFLFVIMLLGGASVHKIPSIKWQSPAAIFLGAVLLIEAAFFLFRGLPGFAKAVPTILIPAFGGPTEVGDILFDQYLLPFEITSILLLAAMTGAIVLTRRIRRK